MKKIIYLSLFLFPGLVFAQARFTDFRSLIDFFTQAIVGSIIPLLIGLAIVYFFWGVAKYIKNSDDESEREKARSYMVWGVIGLFVMISVWGLVGVLANTFGIRVTVPGLPNTPSTDCVTRYGAAYCNELNNSGI